MNMALRSDAKFIGDRRSKQTRRNDATSALKYLPCFTNFRFCTAKVSCKIMSPTVTISLKTQT